MLEDHATLISIVHGCIDLLNDLLVSYDLYDELKKWHGEESKHSDIVTNYPQLYVSMLKKNNKDQIYLPFGYSNSIYKDEYTKKT